MMFQYTPIFYFYFSTFLWPILTIAHGTIATWLSRLLLWLLLWCPVPPARHGGERRNHPRRRGSAAVPSQKRPRQLGLALRIRREARERAGGLPAVLRRLGSPNQLAAAPHAAVLVQAQAVVENHVFVVYHAPVPPGEKLYPETFVCFCYLSFACSLAWFRAPSWFAVSSTPRVCFVLMPTCLA